MTGRWYLLFLICSTVAITSSVAQHTIVLKPGDTAKIQNAGYPEAQSGGGRVRWKVETVQGGAVRLDCEEINIKPANQSCKNGNITLDSMNGGMKHFICDKAKGPVSLISIKNTLEVTLILGKARGTVSCAVTALKSRPETVPEVHDITLNPWGGYNDIVLNPVRPYQHYVWNFKTKKGYQIVVACQNFMIPITSGSEEVHCKKFEAKFVSGNKEQRYCKAVPNLVVYSDGESLTVTMKSSLGGSGLVNCRAKSALPGSEKKFKHIASEEVDSSEYGSISNKGKGKVTSCSCGYANKDTKRVIYGYDAGPNEYPWMVSLQEFRVHFCGGSIITPYHVLTAAHCTLSKNAKWVKVLIGVNNYRDVTGGQEIKVKSIINHSYDKDSSSRDIALLDLEEKIQFSAKVGPICLPKTNPHPSKIVGQYVTAMGWGKLAVNEKQDQAILKETRLRAVDLYTCSMEWGFKWEVENPSLICTWSNHTDICMGDSGGPVVWLDPETNRYVLVGMPSYCDGCVLTKPSAHTAVFYFYDWIQDNIAKTSHPEERTCSKVD